MAGAELVRYVGVPSPILKAIIAEGPLWRVYGERILTRAKVLCPVSDDDDSGDGGGHLRDKLEARFIGGADARILIGATDARANYVINGTDPHPIDPVNASVLVFTVGGQTVFARHVDHPGTKPNNFPLEAMKQIAQENLGY